VAAADSWFAHAEIAQPAPAPRRRPAGTHPKGPVRSRRKQAHRRVRLPIVWMTVFAVLLAGVVAVNVAVLRAHVAVSKLDQEQAKLEAENQGLASRLSAASSAPRIEAAARRLGLVQAPATAVTYLDLMPRHR
jgi:cell division protein FtsL